MVLVLDDRELTVDHTREPYDLIRPDLLQLERFEVLAARLTEAELVRAVQPSLLRLALERAGGSPVIYLDPRTEVFASLDSFGEMVADRAFALVPRFTEPIPRDGLRPTEIDALQTGIFDAGCLACRGGERCLRLLRAWAERLRYAGVDEGSTAFSRWHDLLATLAPYARIVDDAGIGVSVWNLHERRLIEKDGRVLVNGVPLRSLCFDGLEPWAGTPDDQTEQMLSRGRAFLQRGMLLARLAGERADALAAAPHASAESGSYGFENLADGTALTPSLRKWIRLAERHGGLQRSPFTTAGAAELVAWLKSPTTQGEVHDIPRLWLFIYADSRDLQQRFPDLDGRGGEAFVEWVREAGEREYEVAPLLRISSLGDRTE
jgi:hypothetical protein